MKTPKVPRAYPPIEPEQEPVAWMTHTNDLQPLFHKTRTSALVWQSQPTPLYSAPPKREWVGLTDDAVFELADTNLYDGGKNYGVLAFAKAIEQALKEKNNG